MLQNNESENIVNFDWLIILDELQNRCPFLLEVLNTVTTKKKPQSELAPRIGIVYAILMLQRNHELSLVQRINTLIMTEGNPKNRSSKYIYLYAPPVPIFILKAHNFTKQKNLNIMGCNIKNLI